MKFGLDQVDNRVKITRGGTPVSVLHAYAGGTEPLDLAFFLGSSTKKLSGTEWAIHFGFKDSEGTLLALADNWTFNPDTISYQAMFSLNTAEILIALGDADSITVYAQLAWSLDPDDTPFVSQVIEVTLHKNVIGLNEGTPTDLPTPVIWLQEQFANAAEKTTPVDADSFLIRDSAAAGVLKKLTWANTKATIKTWYDAVTSTLTNKTIQSGTFTGTHTVTGTANGGLPNVNLDGSVLPGTNYRGAAFANSGELASNSIVRTMVDTRVPLAVSRDSIPTGGVSDYKTVWVYPSRNTLNLDTLLFGVYSYDGEVNGKPSFRKDAFTSIYWDGIDSWLVEGLTRTWKKTGADLHVGGSWVLDVGTAVVGGNIQLYFDTLKAGQRIEYTDEDDVTHYYITNVDGAFTEETNRDASNVADKATEWRDAIGIPTAHRVKIRRSAPFSLSTSANTFNLIPFDTTEFATDPESADLANDRIICPRAGWYRIMTTGALKDIVTPIPRIVIRVEKYSAANVYQGVVLWRDRYNYGGRESLEEMSEVYLNTGDQLNLAYFKDVTDAAAIEDEGFYYNPALEIHEAQPTSLPVKTPALSRKIITDGDSNTAGTLCGADEVWTKWLTSGTIVNRAVSGRTVADILADSATIISGADITADYILAAGVNDLGFNVGSDLEDLADKIEAIFEIAAPLHRSVTWITPAKVNYPGYANNAAINAEIAALTSIVEGRGLGINIVDLYADSVLGSGSTPLAMLDLLWRVDGLHFSPLAQKRIADLTAAFLN